MAHDEETENPSPIRASTRHKERLQLAEKNSSRIYRLAYIATISALAYFFVFRPLLDTYERYLDRIPVRDSNGTASRPATSSTNFSGAISGGLRDAIQAAADVKAGNPKSIENVLEILKNLTAIVNADGKDPVTAGAPPGITIFNRNGTDGGCDCAPGTLSKDCAPNCANKRRRANPIKKQAPAPKIR